MHSGSLTVIWNTHTYLDNMFIPDGELLHEFREEIDVTSLTTYTSGEQLVEQEVLREAIVRSVGGGRGHQ